MARLNGAPVNSPRLAASCGCVCVFVCLSRDAGRNEFTAVLSVRAHIRQRLPTSCQLLRVQTDPIPSKNPEYHIHDPFALHISLLLLTQYLLFLFLFFFPVPKINELSCESTQATVLFQYVQYLLKFLMHFFNI